MEMLLATFYTLKLTHFTSSLDTKKWTEFESMFARVVSIATDDEIPQKECCSECVQLLQLISKYLFPNELFPSIHDECRSTPEMDTFRRGR
jgi:hypothetical protein